MRDIANLLTPFLMPPALRGRESNWTKPLVVIVTGQSAGSLRAASRCVPVVATSIVARFMALLDGRLDKVVAAERASVLS